MRWCREFCVEVGERPSIELIDAGRWGSSRFGDRHFTFWETPGGTPVSLAAVTPVVGGMVRVDPVYTPARRRGRGYAGAVTVEVSRAALSAGATDVVLFADPANPTSNALYRRIGYVHLADFAGHRFAYGGPATGPGRTPRGREKRWPPGRYGVETSRVTLHENEIPVDEALVRSLLREQRPEWAGLPLAPAGAGTDNTMYRLGDDLVVRLPRTADGAPSLRKEQEWLPRLAPHLPCPVPEPVHAGTPTDAYPVPWSVHRWIDGEEPGPDTVRDWAAFGAGLAAVVRDLHRVDLMGATRADGLSWYRGGSLVPCDEWVGTSLDACRTLAGLDLDIDTLERLWLAALELPEPSGPHVGCTVTSDRPTSWPGAARSTR